MGVRTWVRAWRQRRTLRGHQGSRRLAFEQAGRAQYAYLGIASLAAYGRLPGETYVGFTERMARAANAANRHIYNGEEFNLAEFI